MEKQAEVPQKEEEKHRIRGFLDKLHLRESSKPKTFEQAFELIRRDLELVYVTHKDTKKGLKPMSLDKVLESIDAEEKNGALYREADFFQDILEKRRKDFEKDKWLTERIRGMIAVVGKGILSKDEIKEAQDRFKGAKYFMPNIISLEDTGGAPRAIYNLGWVVVDTIMREEDRMTSINRLELHEAVHHINAFLRLKQVESGDTKDPIIRKLHGYLHGKYDDEVIWAVENRYTGVYVEAVADAVSFDTMRSLGLPPYSTKNNTPPGVAGIAFFANFLHDNPEKFKELMLNPSEAVSKGCVKAIG